MAVARAGSITEASRNLFISQPSLSASIRELEKELGFALFRRSSHGISVTKDGMEFIGYADQVLQQYRLMERKYLEGAEVRQKFSVSMQHYTFAVHAFVKLVRQLSGENYEFALCETKTIQVLEDVRNLVSEIGVLYVNSGNQNVMARYFRDYGLRFEPLLECGIYTYLWKEHPLAGRDSVTLESLSDYICLSFDQGVGNPWFFSEEVVNTDRFSRRIRVSDRATVLNLLAGLNAFILCSGKIEEAYNTDGFVAVPVDTEERMTVGCVTRKNAPVSMIGRKYLDLLRETIGEEK